MHVSVIIVTEDTHHLGVDVGVRCGKRPQVAVEEVADGGAQTRQLDALHVRLEQVLHAPAHQLAQADYLSTKSEKTDQKVLVHLGKEREKETRAFSTRPFCIT